MTRKQKAKILAQVIDYRMTTYRSLFAYIIEDGEIILTRYRPSHYTTEEYMSIRYGEMLEIVKTKGEKKAAERF